MELFSHFPKVMYNGVNSLNLMKRIAAVRSNLDKFAVYYPYVIKDGERPDTIAYDYYGQSSYAWLVMIVNDVYHYYSDWPLTGPEFHDYLMKTYGYVYELKNDVHHYVYTGNGESAEEIARKDWWMSPGSYALASMDERLGWSPVSVFDYEDNANEEKRQILLISNELLSRVDREITEMFADGAE